jgi:O-glycosyl hydrolase
MYFSSIALICAFTIAFAVAKVTITVDTTTTYQTIDGFGFSEAFGFGKAVQNAPSAQQTQALNYMFSTTEGAGLTILRNRVAADPADTIEPTSPGSPSATPTMYGMEMMRARFVYPLLFVVLID